MPDFPLDSKFFLHLRLESVSLASLTYQLSYKHLLPVIFVIFPNRMEFQWNVVEYLTCFMELFCYALLTLWLLISWVVLKLVSAFH